MIVNGRSLDRLSIFLLKYLATICPKSPVPSYLSMLGKLFATSKKLVRRTSSVRQSCTSTRAKLVTSIIELEDIKLPKLLQIIFRKRLETRVPCTSSSTQRSAVLSPRLSQETPLKSDQMNSYRSESGFSSLCLRSLISDRPVSTFKTKRKMFR